MKGKIVEPNAQNQRLNSAAYVWIDNSSKELEHSLFVGCQALKLQNQINETNEVGLPYDSKSKIAIYQKEEESFRPLLHAWQCLAGVTCACGVAALPRCRFTTVHPPLLSDGMTGCWINGLKVM